MHKANSANSFLRVDFSLHERAKCTCLCLLPEMLNEVSSLQQQFWCALIPTQSCSEAQLSWLTSVLNNHALPWPPNGSYRNTSLYKVSSVLRYLCWSWEASNLRNPSSAQASPIFIHTAFLLLHSYQQHALLTHTLNDEVEQNCCVADPALTFPVPSKSPWDTPETHAASAGGPADCKWPV